MSNRLKLSVAAVATMAIAYGATVPSPAQAKVEGDTITLGAALSLSGKYSTAGNHTQRGYELAKKIINDAGGVKVGGKSYKIDIKYYDDESTPARGAQLTERLIKGPFTVGALEVLPFVQGHGRETSLGFRFGPVAYSTDAVELDELAFEVLDGVEVWIVDCLREAPHPTHAHFARTLEWIARVKPRRAILTHMNHTLDYDALAARCPPGVEPGYDGMVIEIAAETVAE